MDTALNNQIWIYGLAAFFAVTVLMIPVLKLAPHLKLLDKPGGRKQHDGDVPLMGGLVIFPVFVSRFPTSTRNGSTFRLSSPNTVIKSAKYARNSIF